MTAIRRKVVRIREPDPADVGRRILRSLERARERAAEIDRDRVNDLRDAVARLADRDIARGKPAHGRAGRISRQLKGIRGGSRRNVQRILDSLSGMASSE